MKGRKMRILALNYEFPPLGGGSANGTRYLLREMSSHESIELDLVTSSTGEFRIEQFADRFRVHYLDIGKKGNLHYQTNKDLLVYSWKALKYARKLMAEKDYDLCHAYFGIPCGYMARKLGMPYIVTLQGSDVPFFNERFYYLDKFVFRNLSRRIWRHSETVVANSNGLRNLALQTSPTQEIRVIPNGANARRFTPSPEARTSKTLKIVSVSRLIARKRIDMLVRAIGELHDSDIELNIYGSGNEEDNLRALANELKVQNKVHFHGYVAHDDIVPCYQNADVMVLPSANEGMSNTVMEALACGLPVIVTSTGGSEELLKDGVNGFIVEKDSVSDIAAKLRCYLEDPGLIEEHGKESRQVAESISWASVAERYVDLYQEMLNRPTTQRQIN